MAFELRRDTRIKVIMIYNQSCVARCSAECNLAVIVRALLLLKVVIKTPRQ